MLEDDDEDELDSWSEEEFPFACAVLLVVDFLFFGGASVLGGSFLALPDLDCRLVFFLDEEEASFGGELLFLSGDGGEEEEEEESLVAPPRGSSTAIVAATVCHSWGRLGGRLFVAEVLLAPTAAGACLDAARATMAEDKRGFIVLS